MGSVSSFIKMIAGIVITLAVIAFGFLVYNTVKGTGTKALTQATDTTNAMLESNITQYSRNDISGDEVLNAITSFSASSDEIYIEVVTKSGGSTVYIYPGKTIAASNRQSNREIQDALKDAKTKGSSAYISPKGKFMGSVVYDTNDDSIIVGLLFEQQ